MPRKHIPTPSLFLSNNDRVASMLLGSDGLVCILRSSKAVVLCEKSMLKVFNKLKSSRWLHIIVYAVCLRMCNHLYSVCMPIRQLYLNMCLAFTKDLEGIFVIFSHNLLLLRKNWGYVDIRRLSEFSCFMFRAINFYDQWLDKKNHLSVLRKKGSSARRLCILTLQAIFCSIVMSEIFCKQKFEIKPPPRHKHYFTYKISTSVVTIVYCLPNNYLFTELNSRNFQ